MTDRPIPAPDVLDLAELPPDRRASSLQRAFRYLSPGEELLVAGRGDPGRYQKLLRGHFTATVLWRAIAYDDDRWVAGVSKAA